MTKLFLAAAMLMLASPALAESALDRDTPSAAVSTKGVNFDDPAQARQFYTRLQAAARYVCESDPNHLAVAADLTCVRANVTDAVRQLNAPRLTALADRTYGPSQSGRATAFATDDR